MSSKNKNTPPSVKKIPHTLTQFKEVRNDPYNWIRGKKPDDWQQVLKDPSLLDPDIRKHLDDENSYFKSHAQNFDALTKQIGDELVGRVIPNDSTVPERDGDWQYWKEFRAQGDFPVFMRRNVHTNVDQAYYDGDKEKGDSSFFKLGDVGHSPDHKYIAYSLDREGSEYYTIRFREIETGKELEEEISFASPEIIWDKKASSIYYIECDDNHRPKQVKCHVLGTDPKNDPVVYQENDDRYYLHMEKSLSGDYIFFVSSAPETTEVHFLKSDAVAGTQPTLIQKREQGHEYHVSHHGDFFYIRTNDDGAVEFKVMSTPTKAFTKEHWVDVIPYNQTTIIEKILTFKDYMVRTEYTNALPSIVISDYAGNEYALKLPDEAYTAEPLAGYQYDTNKLRIDYNTPAHPGITYELNMATQKKSILKEKKLPNGHDPSQYIVERKFITARDNKTKIPVTLIRHKSTKTDGSAPLFQYGYGSYAANFPANFSSHAISLCDRGVIYAFAHVRGGGELGRKWYMNGKKENKVNSFTDFIDVTEGLIQHGYGAKGKVCIEGRSAGGLLMGAVTNMRPDLYAGVIAGVPFVDVLNTISDATLPLTPPEWEEWGNPIKDKAAYETIKSYSPYDNIGKDKTYPAILATAGLTDFRVTYWEPAKWIARLREKTKGGPFFMKTAMNAGHAGSAARYEKIRERAPEFAFIMQCFKQKGYDISFRKGSPQHPRKRHKGGPSSS